MECHKKLGILGILKEALFAGLKTWKISVATIILATVLIHFMIGFFQILDQHLVLDLVPIATQLPLIKRAFPDIDQGEFKIFPFQTILGELLALLNVHLAVMSCNESHFGMKELMLKINRTWKGSLITTICTALVFFVSPAILFMFGFFLKMMSPNGLALSIAFVALLALTFFVIYVNALVHLIENVSLVISVVEESCCGYSAMRKAAGLIRRRKLHGIALIGVVFLITYLISKFPSDEQGGLMFVVLKLVLKVVNSLCLFYNHLIFTVYYRECKKSFERGRGEVASGLFSLLPYTSNIEIAP